MNQPESNIRDVREAFNPLKSRIAEIIIKASIMSSAKENTTLVHFLPTGAVFALFEVYDSNIATGKYFFFFSATGIWPLELAKCSNHPSFHCVSTRSLEEQS